MPDPALLRGLLVFSVVFFIVGVLSVPWLVGKIPEDYFLRPRRHWRDSYAHYGLVFPLLLVIKNLLGLLLLVAGILMLFLPGQGLLSMFLGLLLMDFPGKYRCERWLIRQPAIYKSINWIREKQQIPPVQLPPDSI